MQKRLTFSVYRHVQCGSRVGDAKGTRVNCGPNLIIFLIMAKDF